MVNTLSECRALVPFGHKNAPGALGGSARNAPSAAFLAQLIAIRAGAEGYRARRREHPRIAAAAYQSAMRLGQKTGVVATTTASF